MPQTSRLAPRQSASHRRRLVVVSNRTAAPGVPGSGGLAVAVRDALGERGGFWFGWSGRVSDRADAPRLVSDGSVDFALADLTAEEHAGYYLGYANRVLWPAFHYRLDLADCDEKAFACYAAVNRRFARLLAPMLRADDLVWVHDYHLLLLARELRAAGWEGVAGFFLHVPFPAPEIFAALPHHAELGQGLAEFDAIGFQTRRDAENFQRYAVGSLDATAHGDGLVSLGRRSLRVGAFPVGIDHAQFAEMVSSPAAREAAGCLRRATGDRALVLGADRLDYTKGLPHRLRAFERLLQTNPDLRGRVSLLQIAAPSRSELPCYRALAAEVDRISGRINGAFGDLDWTPVQHLARHFRRDVLSGFMRVARVGLVTSLHDGMNLVAKEFVAAQDPADPGVLVLSRFAGAADQLGAALLVNPHDPCCVAGAIRRALDMPLDERRDRWLALDDCVRREDAGWWQRRFLETLQATRPGIRSLPRPATDDLAAAV